MDAERKPPAAIRQALMQEVGFGCPVTDKSGPCRSPFLAFHHFDPTWRDGRIHRQEGMIALCARHHAHADGGAFSNDALRELKRTGASKADVRAEYCWSERAFLVRIGGCYAAAEPEQPLTVLRIDDIDAVSLRRRDNGRLSLNLTMPVPGTGDAIIMEDNALTCPVGVIHSLEAGMRGDRTKIWIDKQRVGLAFRFKRLSPPQLQRLLMSDWHRTNCESYEDDTREVPGVVPTNVEFLLKTAVKELNDGDGCIPMIDFERFSIRRSSGSLVVGDELIEGCRFNMAIGCSVAFAINSSGGAAFSLA